MVIVRGLLDEWKTRKLQFCEHYVLGNISELDSLQVIINQRGCFTIYIQTFGDL